LLRLLNRLFHGPAWLTFVAMGVAVGGFALCSLNLFELFHANFRLLTTYGVMAALDGGLLQLVELIAWGYLALADNGHAKRGSRFVGAGEDLAPALPADGPDHDPALVGRQERRADFAALIAMRVVLIGDLGL
jgi:hypothetical protein